MTKKIGFVLIIGFCISLLLFSFKKNEKGQNVTNQEIVSKSKSAKSKLKKAEKQLELLLSKAEAIDSIPRTVENGKIKWINSNYDWTEGFFPGSCWLLYEATNNSKWKEAGESFQSKIEEHKNLTNDHDLGFIFNCSYGNGYRLTKNEKYKEVLITAAKSLATRFNPIVGAIKSWDVDSGWQSKKGWKYPIIIDNMMNLELLFEASVLTGDTTYKNIAIAHANTTMKNHFRKDFSSYHVVDYDPATGKVRGEYPAQGVSRESSWARGQAWGLYAYTMCYRFTKDVKYLKQAENIANYIMTNKKVPNDGIPYWDYDAPNIPKEPRDASAAAITASALIELDQYSSKNYKSYVDKIMNTLNSADYLAATGENNFFILKHSVGSIPHGQEIDAPLNYADYYYLEALMRLTKLQ